MRYFNHINKSIINNADLKQILIDLNLCILLRYERTMSKIDILRLYLYTLV